MVILSIIYRCVPCALYIDNKLKCSCLFVNIKLVMGFPHESIPVGKAHNI